MASRYGSLGEAVILLSADSAQLRGDMGRAVQTVESSMGRVRSVLGPLAGIVAGAFSVQAIVGFGREAMRMANDLETTSAVLKLSTDRLLQLEQAAQLAGVNVESVTMGFQRMERRVGEAAQGTGAAVNALQRYNLNARELANLAPEQQFLKILGVIRDITNQSEKLAFAQKVFDREGAAMAVALSKNFGSVRQALTTSDKSIRDATKSVDILRQETDRLGQAFDVLGLKITGAFAELLGFKDPLKAVEDEIKSLTGELARSQRGAFPGAGEALSKSIESRLALLKRQRESMIAAAGGTETTPGAAAGTGAAASATSAMAAATAKTTSAVQSQIDALQEQVATFGKSSEAIALYRAGMAGASEDQMTQISLLASAAANQKMWNDRLTDTKGAVQAVTPALSEAADRTRSLSQAAQDLSWSFQSAFEDAVISGKKFGDVLQGLAQDIERILMRKFVTNPLANAIGSGFDTLLGGIFGGGGSSGFAGAFSGSGISSIGASVPSFSFPSIPHLASGGIVNKATVALVGESGPEAVVPLGKAGKSQPMVVVAPNISIHAIDTRSFADRLVEVRGVVTAIINDSLNKHFRRAI